MLIKDDASREQHDAVRNTAGWYCWTHFLLEVKGEDAPTFLDKIFISSIAKMKVGRAKYTAMCNEDGIIIDDVIVFRLEEEKYWISTLHMYKLIPWLNAHKGDSKVEYEEITDKTEMYAIQGPKSKDLLNAFLAENIDDQKFFTIRDNKIDDVPVKVARGGYTGELGYEVYVAPEYVDLLKAKLTEHSKAFDAMEIIEFQVTVWSLATEKGYCLMSDLRETNPFEVGFEGSINWNKDFIGKEALEKIKAEGAKRQLLGFVAEDEKAHIESMNRGAFGDPVVVNGEEVGRATKYVYSYTFEKSIGFALVDETKVKIGDTVTIGGWETTLTDRTFQGVESKSPVA